jgi:hypothetical protein
MAILDRPLFKKRINKNLLRQYGIPAFANGGVVQTSNPFGIDLGYTESGAISSKPPFNMFKGLTLEEYESMSPEDVLKAYAGLDTRGIAEGMEESVAESLDIIKEQEDLRKASSATKDRKERREEEPKTFSEVIEELGAEDVDKTPRDERAEEKKQKKLEEETEDQGTQAESGPDAETRFDDVTKKSNTTITGATTDPFQGDSGVSDERTQMSKLQDIIKERSALYKQLLGDPKKQLEQQGFLQLAQFGLNLAAARGGNLAEKIAKSATDPLQTFAALARDAAKDERAIELAAIESGEAQLLKEIDNQGDLSTIGKSVRDIARIQNIPINEAFAVYENLLNDEEKVTSFDRFVSAQDAQTIPNNVQAARASGSIPQSLLLDLNNFVAEDGNFDKKLITEQYNLGEGFKFQDSETGKIFMGIPKDSSLRDKKKKTLTFDDDPNKSDFIILKDIDVFSF